MGASECDDQFLRAGGPQLLGPEASVIEIAAEAAGRREVEQLEERGQGATDDPETGVALPDVVEQRGASCVGSAGESESHGSGGLQAVALVGDGLPPEEGSLFGAEERGDLGLLVRSEGLGPKHFEEPSHQMPHPAAQITSRITHPMASPMKASASSNTKMSTNRIRKPYCET